MAYTPKHKKLEKNDKDSELPVASGGAKFYCCRCGIAYSRRKGYFPVSHSPMYRGSGFLPICNECIDELYNSYLEKLRDDRLAMKRMCMKMDLYWSESIYDMVERSAGTNSRIRCYIGKTNIIRFIDKTYDDTIADEERDARLTGKIDIPYMNTGAPQKAEVSAETMEFWGRGYDPSFYEDLERKYQKWTSGLGELSPVQESLYKTVCLNELLIERDGAKGIVSDKANKALMDALGSLNIKPSQVKNDGDADLDKMPLGVGIQMWESRRPLPPTDESLKDVNNVVRQITTWFLGHACKMVGLRNSYCKLYEDAMEELRVKMPEYADEDDDTMLSDIFGNHTEDKTEASS